MQMTAPSPPYVTYVNGGGQMMYGPANGVMGSPPELVLTPEEESPAGQCDQCRPLVKVLVKETRVNNVGPAETTTHEVVGAVTEFKKELLGSADSEEEEEAEEEEEDGSCPEEKASDGDSGCGSSNHETASTSSVSTTSSLDDSLEVLSPSAEQHEFSASTSADGCDNTRSPSTHGDDTSEESLDKSPPSFTSTFPHHPQTNFTNKHVKLYPCPGNAKIKLVRPIKEIPPRFQRLLAEAAAAKSFELRQKQFEGAPLVRSDNLQDCKKARAEANARAWKLNSEQFAQAEHFSFNPDAPNFIPGQPYGNNEGDYVMSEGGTVQSQYPMQVIVCDSQPPSGEHLDKDNVTGLPNAVHMPPPTNRVFVAPPTYNITIMGNAPIQHPVPSTCSCGKDGSVSSTTTNNMSLSSSTGSMVPGMAISNNGQCNMPNPMYYPPPAPQGPPMCMAPPYMQCMPVPQTPSVPAPRQPAGTNTTPVMYTTTQPAPLPVVHAYPPQPQ